jgi:hypothetical protein
MNQRVKDRLARWNGCGCAHVVDNPDNAIDVVPELGDEAFLSSVPGDAAQGDYAVPRDSFDRIAL